MPKEILVSVDGRDTKQCRWEYYRGGGPGGQNRNKTSTAARVTHLPSDATASAQEHTSQRKNREAAWKRLAQNPKFKAWLKLECAKALGHLKDIEAKVNNWMRPTNLKVERHNQEGLWTEWKSTDPDWNQEEKET